MFKFSRLGGLVIVVAVLIGGFGVSSVYGQAITTTANFEQDFGSSGTPLCGGEDVAFSGTAHFVFHDTITATGLIHSRMHMNNMNTEAIGLTSGDKYVIRETNSFVVNTNAVTDETGILVFHTGITGKLIHTGKDVNTGFRLLLKVIYEPDGDLISEVEKVDINCNGS